MGELEGEVLGDEAAGTGDSKVEEVRREKLGLGE